MRQLEKTAAFARQRKYRQAFVCKELTRFQGEFIPKNRDKGEATISISSDPSFPSFASSDENCYSADHATTDKKVPVSQCHATSVSMCCDEKLLAIPKK